MTWTPEQMIRRARTVLDYPPPRATWLWSLNHDGVDTGRAEIVTDKNIRDRVAGIVRHADTPPAGWLVVLPWADRLCTFLFVTPDDCRQVDVHVSGMVDELADLRPGDSDVVDVLREAWLEALYKREGKL